MGYTGILGVDYFKIDSCISALGRAIDGIEKQSKSLSVTKSYAHRAYDAVRAAQNEDNRIVIRIQALKRNLKSFKEEVETFDQAFANAWSTMAMNEIEDSNESLTATVESFLRYVGLDKKNALRTHLAYVADGDCTAVGGNQAWFNNQVYVDGGCGVVASSNILAYYALLDPALADAFGVNKASLSTKEGYLAFMEHVGQTVVPYDTTKLQKIFSGLSNSFGVWPVSRMADKTVDFAKQNGVTLTYQSLTTADVSMEDILTSAGIFGAPLSAAWHLSKKRSIGYDEGIAFIQAGLQKDCPVALLTAFEEVEMKGIETFNGAVKDKSMTQHWVTITAAEYNTVTMDYDLTISSWGEQFTISYNQLYNSWKSVKALDSGLVYFEVEK